MSTALPATSGDDLLPYWVAFSHVPGIGPRRLSRLIEHFGDVAKAWAAPMDRIKSFLDPGACEVFRSVRGRVDPEAALRAVRAAGARALTQEDPAYPPLLRQVDRAPFVLFVRGDPALLCSRSLAVVGTRDVTEYGQRATHDLVSDLAAAGLCIVSGAALGVDTCAHRSALDAGGMTVAVLGNGIDSSYPVRNRGLLREIHKRGAIVSELPPGAPPLPGNFPARNRIISGLSLATLVVEAGQRSGALITAEFALAQGRDVFAVPGEIFRPQAVGANRLLANGAGLASSALDILMALNLSQVDSQNALRRQAPTDPVEAAILQALQPGAMDTDSLSRQLAMPVAQLARSLTLMELKGMVRAGTGLRWIPLG